MNKKITQSRFFWSILFIALFQYCATGSSKGKKDADVVGRDGNTITVFGEASIYQGDKQLAEQKAIKDAKTVAVRKLLGEQISSKSGVSDGESLGSSLLAKSDGFVKNYEIIDRNFYKLDTQDMIKLTVKCVVEESKLNTAVDALMADIGNPRTMVLVKADLGGTIVNAGANGNMAEAMIIEALKKNGSRVIDASVARKQLAKNPKAQAGADPDSIQEGSPIISIAQEAGAEVLIIGEVKTTDQPPITQMNGKALDKPIYNSSADGTYKIVLLWGDGKIVGTGAENERGPDITPKVARDNAVKKWGEKVAKKVNKQLKDEWFQLAEGNHIILKFTGLNAEEATKFSDDLKEFTAVKDVNQKSTAESGSEWELTYPGKESAFTDELTYKKDRGFNYLSKKVLTIKGSKRGVVEIEFTPIK
ncbi:MAG: lipoprotein LipL46 [Leptospiraceae bacterium]|nr:lipoprotein LipL46 [Leptospiraceae bacterium]MCK6379739.1 lipoprotein LipL46 [Leptospiraceae bacterium]